MFKNKSFSIGLLSFVVLCFGNVDIHSEPQKLTHKQEVDLEQVIDAIREERELFSKYLDNSNKFFDEGRRKENIFYKAHDKAEEEKSKAEEEKSKAEEEKSKAEEAFNEAEEESKIKAQKELDMSIKRYYSSTNDYYESFETLLVLGAKYRNDILFDEPILKFFKEILTKGHNFLEVLAQSLKTTTNILNLKEQKKSVKDCFNISKKLNGSIQNVDPIILNLSTNNILDNLLNTIESIKVVRKTLNKAEEAWDAYTNARDESKTDSSIDKKTLKALYKAYTKSSKVNAKAQKEFHKVYDTMVKTGEKLVKKLESEWTRLGNSLSEDLLNAKKIFKYTIQFIGKDPRAKEVYQEALKAYKEIEKFQEEFGFNE